MFGWLAVASAGIALALFGSKLLVALGLFIAVATFAFPFGLAILVAAGVALTWRSRHEPSHWGQPE